MSRTQLTDEQAAYAAFREGVEQGRWALWRAAWSRDWVDAEPKIRDGRDVLAAALGVWYLADDIDEPTQVLWTGAYEALQLVLRALVTAGQLEAEGESPTWACRRLVSETITTLDEALDTAKRL